MDADEKEYGNKGEEKDEYGKKSEREGLTEEREEE